ncbi:MAG: hypothetical protein ABW168_02180 [Sedimenticola sp.]
MEVIVSFIDKWQTLLGAIIGGIFALWVALLVAYKVRRQEDLAAAMLLVGNLVTFKSSFDVLTKLAVEDRVTNEELPLWFSEKHVKRRLKLSPLFEVSRIRLMPIDTYLAVHLEMFQFIFADIDEKIERLSEDFAEFKASGSNTRNRESLERDAKTIYNGFKKIAGYAECAERIITLKILSNYPTFHAFRMFLYKTKKERRCKKLVLNQE